MNREITAVFPTKNYKLILEFNNKEYRVIDALPIFAGKNSPMGAIVASYETFSKVFVIPECRTIGWANGVDLDPDVLYTTSTLIKELN